jgi:hypothetical protein
MQFVYSVYYESTAFTCFKHYLLIFRRRCINNDWYIACIFCRLAATKIEVPLQTWWERAHTIARNVPIVVYAEPPEDEQVVLETCRGMLIHNKLNKKRAFFGSTILIYYDARSTNH